AGKGWTFWMPPVPEEQADGGPEPMALEHIDAKPTELVCGDLDRWQLLRVLTNLYRRSSADYQERGLRVLHAAFGVLEWRDQDGAETFRSPLVLVPVELTRPSIREPFTLAAVEEDPFLNPALQARLQQDFAFRLPEPPEDWSEKTLTQYLGEVRSAV